MEIFVDKHDWVENELKIIKEVDKNILPKTDKFRVFEYLRKTSIKVELWDSIWYTLVSLVGLANDFDRINKFEKVFKKNLKNKSQ